MLLQPFVGTALDLEIYARQAFSAKVGQGIERGEQRLCMRGAISYRRGVSLASPVLRLKRMRHPDLLKMKVRTISCQRQLPLSPAASAAARSPRLGRPLDRKSTRLNSSH